MKIKTQTELFCEFLDLLKVANSKALCTLVKSLSSHYCGSVVSLSLSEEFGRHYTMINKVVKSLSVRGVAEDDAKHYANVRKKVQHFISPWLPSIRTAGGISYYGLSLDATSGGGEHAKCRKNRGFVYSPNNQVPGNKTVKVGNTLSVLHLNVVEQGVRWAPPLDVRCVDLDNSTTAVGVTQIKDLLLDKTLPFHAALSVLKMDNQYCNAFCIAPLYELVGLVNIIRARHGQKVYFPTVEQTPGTSAPKPQGAKVVYGKEVFLKDVSENKVFKKTIAGRTESYTKYQESIVDTPADEQTEQHLTLGNGRQVICLVKRWNNCKIRTKHGFSMKDKPLDVVRISVIDAQSKKTIYNRPTFLFVTGQQKTQIPLDIIAPEYRERYDVEPTYRFSKQHLLLDKFQTPDEAHLDNWLLVWQLAFWLLFVARKEAALVVNPWEQYLPNYKNKLNKQDRVLTPAQTKRGMKTLFATLGIPRREVQKCEKIKGAPKGRQFEKRPTYSPSKKGKKDPIEQKKQLNC